MPLCFFKRWRLAVELISELEVNPIDVSGDVTDAVVVVTVVPMDVVIVDVAMAVGDDSNKVLAGDVVGKIDMAPELFEIALVVGKITLLVKLGNFCCDCALIKDDVGVMVTALVGMATELSIVPTGANVSLEGIALEGTFWDSDNVLGISVLAVTDDMVEVVLIECDAN